MELMASGKVLPYLDISLPARPPHRAAADEASGAQEKTLARVLAWRDAVPDITLRSTFIVASPARPRRSSRNCWTSSTRHSSTAWAASSSSRWRAQPANALENPVPDEVKAERYDRFMLKQQAISARRLKRKVGTRQQVIIDSVTPGGAIGRTKGDAPEIDGSVKIASRRPLRVGEIATVKIEAADAYDLIGSAVGF